MTKTEAEAALRRSVEHRDACAGSDAIIITSESRGVWSARCLWDGEGVENTGVGTTEERAIASLMRKLVGATEHEATIWERDAEATLKRAGDLRKHAEDVRETARRLREALR